MPRAWWRPLASIASLVSGVALVVAEIGLVVLFLELFGEPTRRGFFCDDDSIKYPFQSNTVSEGTIAASAILLPMLVVLLTEIWTFGFRSRNKVACWRLTLPAWVQTVLQFCGVYLLGIGFSQIASEMGKFTVGRLRPHFLAVCMPDADCASPSNAGRYITDYTCSGDVDSVFEARMSFPSGHATLSFYACVFLVAYMQSSRAWSHIGLVRHIVQFVFVLAAWYVSLSRVMDNWHHWSDVVAGGVLGSVVAVFVIKYATQLKLKGPYKNDELLPLRRTNSSAYVPQNQP